ncbi:hypothetical protein [Streptomyces sp. NPDC056160]|uniref:hypothetical protein n=1 Tax=Streptomyces sp. NPDC056160 TaxID=3345731 RepID=UPI0035D60DB3
MRRIGGEDDRFLVVQRIPDLPDVFVQVWHEVGGDSRTRRSSSARSSESRVSGGTYRLCP